MPPKRVLWAREALQPHLCLRHLPARLWDSSSRPPAASRRRGHLPCRLLARQSEPWQGLHPHLQPSLRESRVARHLRRCGTLGVTLRCQKDPAVHTNYFDKTPSAAPMPRLCWLISLVHASLTPLCACRPIKQVQLWPQQQARGPRQLLLSRRRLLSTGWSRRISRSRSMWSLCCGSTPTSCRRRVCACRAAALCLQCHTWRTTDGYPFIHSHLPGSDE